MQPTNAFPVGGGDIPIDPTQAFGAMIDQFIRSPASLLIIFVVSILAYVLEIWPSFPSRWIPIICIVILGPTFYFFMVSPRSVPSSFPYPAVVLLANGVIVGFLASILHVSLIRWAIKKFSLIAAQDPLNPPKP